MTTKQIFDEPQPEYIKSATGRVLVCVNEKEVTEPVPVFDNDGNEVGTDEVTRYEYDTVWLIPLKQNDEEVLTAMKRDCIADINAYDISSDVNGFTLNGKQMWLDRDTRLALKARLDAEEAMGKTDTTVWYMGYGINLKIEDTKQMLTVLEVYASECYDVTASHKAAVRDMTSLAEIASYDITADYPEQLAFTI